MANPKIIEGLLRRYCAIKGDQAVLADQEAEAVEEIRALCSQETDRTELTGETIRAVVLRRFSVSYPTPRGHTHPLRSLLSEFPALSEYVRVTYAESGSRLGKLVGRLDDVSEPVPPELLEMVEAVAAARTVKEGKPGITIDPLVVDADGEPDA